MVLAVPSDLGRGNAKLAQLAKFIDNTSAREFNVLRIAANVASGETITIGGDVYQFDTIGTTPSGSPTVVGAMTTSTNKIVLSNQASVNYKAGDVLLIGSEFVYITAQNSDGSYHIVRGWAASTAATHTAATAFSTSATPGTLATAGKVTIPVTATVTPVVVGPALVALLNAFVDDNHPSDNYVAKVLSTGVILVTRTVRGSYALATTETMAGSGNAWDNATFVGGSAAVRRRTLAGSHTVTSADATNGSIVVVHDFDTSPSSMVVQVRTSAGVSIAWDGAIVATAPAGTFPGYVVIDNSGTTDWAATNVIQYALFE